MRRKPLRFSRAEDGFDEGLVRLAAEAGEAVDEAEGDVHGRRAGDLGALDVGDIRAPAAGDALAAGAVTVAAPFAARGKTELLGAPATASAPLAHGDAVDVGRAFVAAHLDIKHST